MKIPTYLKALCAAVLLPSCMAMGISNIEDTSATEVLLPPNPEPGACYGREISPAVFETVTSHAVIRPGKYDKNGYLISPAVYNTETVHKMVREREDIWFKIPCAKDKVADFDASLQRALQVRGYYQGRITGQIDNRTKRAIRRFQVIYGFDSDQLTLVSARKLGLVAVEREPKKK